MGGDEEKRKYPRQQTEDLFVQYRLVKSAFVDAAQNGLEAFLLRRKTRCHFTAKWKLS